MSTQMYNSGNKHGFFYAYNKNKILDNKHKFIWVHRTKFHYSRKQTSKSFFKMDGHHCTDLSFVNVKYLPMKIIVYYKTKD